MNSKTVLSARFSQPIISGLTALLFLFPFLLSAQGSVPYRVGDKFGIADLSGKLVVPATYDFIEVENYSRLYFIGYKFGSSGNVSSVILNNKEIIKDQEFRDYTYDNDLFIGNAYDLEPRKKSGADLSQRSRLFDVTGKDVLNETFSYISIITDIDEENKLDEVLIVTTDQDKKKSILIYDKKQRKISKTVAEDIIDFEVPEMFNSSYYQNKSIVYVYKDAAGEYVKSRFEGNGKVIDIKTEKLIAGWKNTQDRSGFDDVPMPYGDERRGPVEKQEGIRRIEVDLDYYYMPRKLEKIAITYDGFKGRYFEVFTVNGKQGLRLGEDKKIIIPARYDEVIEAEFSTHTGGHIIRSGNKYGLCLYEKDKPVIVEPVFTGIPLVESDAYFGTGKPLIKLYDADGNFFCYANIAGKIFYRAK